MRAPARTVATGLPACCANRCSAGRLRGRERRRPAVPRSGDALGGRRPGDHRVSRLGQPDGPLRDEVAVPNSRTLPLSPICPASGSKRADGSVHPHHRPRSGKNKDRSRQSPLQHAANSLAHRVDRANLNDKFRRSDKLRHRGGPRPRRQNHPISEPSKLSGSSPPEKHGNWRFPTAENCRFASVLGAWANGGWAPMLRILLAGSDREPERRRFRPRAQSCRCSDQLR